MQRDYYLHNVLLYFSGNLQTVMLSRHEINSRDDIVMHSKPYKDVVELYIAEAAREIARRLAPLSSQKNSDHLEKPGEEDPVLKELTDAFRDAVRIVEKLQKIQKAAREISSVFRAIEPPYDPFHSRYRYFEGTRMYTDSRSGESFICAAMMSRPGMQVPTFPNGEDWGEWGECSLSQFVANLEERQRLNIAPVGQHNLLQTRLALYCAQVDAKRHGIPLATPDVTGEWAAELAPLSRRRPPIEVRRFPFPQQAGNSPRFF